MRPASYESLLGSPDDYWLHFTCGEESSHTGAHLMSRLVDWDQNEGGAETGGWLTADLAALQPHWHKNAERAGLAGSGKL
jgi:hypothetical protein